MSLQLCKACSAQIGPLMTKFSPIIFVSNRSSNTQANKDRNRGIKPGFKPDKIIGTPPWGEQAKFFLRGFPDECRKAVQQIKHAALCQPITEDNRFHGMYEIIHRFDEQSKINQWDVVTDTRNSEGFSIADLTFTKDKTAVFHGNLSLRVPNNGWQTYAGYCHIAAPFTWKPFWKIGWDNWELFTDIVLRVRGDGRKYTLVVGQWVANAYHVDDRWIYPFFTRGGPYWQDIKIPLNKLYRIRDGKPALKQEAFIKNRVEHFGISLMDNVEGPFKLEIDYIALMLDRNTNKKHYYEMYDNKWYDKD